MPLLLTCLLARGCTKTKHLTAEEQHAEEILRSEMSFCAFHSRTSYRTRAISVHCRVLFLWLQKIRGSGSWGLPRAPGLCAAFCLPTSRSFYSGGWQFQTSRLRRGKTSAWSTIASPFLLLLRICWTKWKTFDSLLAFSFGFNLDMMEFYPCFSRSHGRKTEKYFGLETGTQ